MEQQGEAKTSGQKNREKRGIRETQGHTHRQLPPDRDTEMLGKQRRGREPAPEGGRNRQIKNWETEK